MSKKKSEIDQVEEILEQAESLQQEANDVLSGNGIGGVRSFLNTKERLEIRRLKAYLKQMDEENHYLREKVEALENLKSLADPKKTKIPRAKGKIRKSAVLALSDIHLTELVDPSITCNGNGSCDQTTGACVCNDPWSGPKCTCNKLSNKSGLEIIQI